MQEFPGTSEVEPNEIYSVPLTVGPHSCTLLINLPASKAGPHNPPPLLFCDPVIPRHPMIAADGQVRLETGMGCDGNLVGIIRRIIQCSQSQNLSSASNTHTASNSSSFNSSMPPRAASPVNLTSSIVNLSDGCQLDVSLINSLSDDQVNNLLNDEEKFRKFMGNFQSAMDNQKIFISEMKRESIERACGNVNVKKEVNELAVKLDEMHKKYSQAFQSYQNFVALNSSALASLNGENILTQIQVNLMELNDSTNNSIRSALHSEDFGNLDLELKECIKMRKEYHKKSILLKKYQE